MAIEDEFLLRLTPKYLDDGSISDPVATPENWTLHVRQALGHIVASKVGSLLLRCIRAQGKWVQIEPYLPSKSLAKLCNAVTEAPAQSADGIGAVVRFTPERYGAGTVCEASHTATRSGYSPKTDEVLFHELVHAFRHTSNTRAPGVSFAKTPGMSTFDNLEEFIAVLVTNIYSSEGKATLRSSHDGHLALHKDWAGSFEFFTISSKAYETVSRFCRENPRLTQALAHIAVPFNPIAAWYTSPAKAKKLSHTAGVASDLGPLGVLGHGLSWPAFRDMMGKGPR